MSSTITFSVEIKSSGGMSSIGYSSQNYVRVANFIYCQNLRLFGSDVISLSISPQNIKSVKGMEVTTRLVFRVELDSSLTNKEIESFARKTESYTTLLLASSDVNPQSGFSYAEVDWLHFNPIETNNSSLQDVWIIMSSAMTKIIELNKEQWNIENEYSNVIFDNYYDGIRATHCKSKYFHWFLIIEVIERSNLYQRKFKEKLFDEDELEAIAKQFENDKTKREAILGLKGRTKKQRAEKLYEVLQEIGVGSCQFHAEKHELSLETVKTMITYRNKLFHRGEKLDEPFVWNEFFPIIREIVNLLLKHPNLLD